MMESQQAARTYPAPGQTAVAAGLPSNTRGASSDTLSRFSGNGVRYRAKLIGMDPVPEAHGEKMCWDSMMKLKGIEAAARKQGRHKPRVWLKINSCGLKIVDERTELVVREHDKSKISSVTKDEADPRALAYIYQHEDSYVLFYLKMATLAYPVLLDIKEVCQKVEQVTPQEPQVTPQEPQVTPQEPQNTALVLLSDTPDSAAQFQDGYLFSPRPDSSSPGLSNQVSSRNELMEVFSPPLEAPLSPIQRSCASPPETSQPAMSAAQILSMFPTQPTGGSPYSFPAYPPTMMPLGQQGLLENQRGGQWPTMPAGLPAWAPPGRSVVLPQPGFMVGGSPAGSPATHPYMNGYPTPLNPAYPPTATTGSLGLDKQSLL